MAKRMNEKRRGEKKRGNFVSNEFAITAARKKFNFLSLTVKEV